MLLVQSFLKDKTFKQLSEEHGVDVSFDKMGYKFSLNYDQIKAKDNDPIAKQCRGLILATKNGVSLNSQAKIINGKLNFDNVCPKETEILSFPFIRFFNYNENNANTVNWNDKNLKIYTKLDGTMIGVYYDQFINAWCVSTRSVPNADLLMDNGIYTFRDLFEIALKNTCHMSFEEYVLNLDPNITYIFELTSDLNQVVVEYKEKKVTLLGGRDRQSLLEIPLANIKSYGVPHVQAISFSSIPKLIDWVENLNPKENEGVVVVDSHFNRLKIKSAAYCFAHKAKDTLSASPRNVMEILLLEKEDDILSFLPEEIKNNLLKIKSGLQQIIKDYDQKYFDLLNQANNIKPNDKKTFALLVQNCQMWQAPFFMIYQGKANDFKDFIKKSRKEGSYPNSFLDIMLKISKNY